MADIRETIAALPTKKDFAHLVGTIEAFAAKAQAYDQKSVTHGHILVEHEAMLRDHHRRVAQC